MAMGGCHDGNTLGAVPRWLRHWRGTPTSQPATQVSAGARFSCTPIKVYDGDGPIWCAEGLRVRLAGIAAREMSGECRPGILALPCRPKPRGTIWRGC